MTAWTFNGKVPGPVIRADEGDTIEVTLRNADRMMAHSVDFHAAQISPQVGFADVPPGETRTFSFVARRPGVFLYHCGTSPVLEHIGMGMYGAILVEPERRPPAGPREGPGPERVLRPGRARTDPAHLQGDADPRSPTFTAFNGRAFQLPRQPDDGAGRRSRSAYLRRRGRADAGQRLPRRRRDLRHRPAGRQPAQRAARRLDLRRARRRRCDVRADLRRSRPLPVRDPLVPLGRRRCPRVVRGRRTSSRGPCPDKTDPTRSPRADAHACSRRSPRPVAR